MLLSGFFFGLVVAMILLAIVIAFLAMEVAIVLIQALVFVILTCSYIKDGLYLH